MRKQDQLFLRSVKKKATNYSLGHDTQMQFLKKSSRNILRISGIASSIVFASFVNEAWADTWGTASIYTVREGVSVSVSSYTPVSGNGDSAVGADFYFRTGAGKFKFSSNSISSSYTTQGETLLVGLGVNRKLNAQTRILVGADLELRNQNATQSSSANGTNLSFRANTTLYHDWVDSDRLSFSFSYAPRYNSYWAAVMSSHDIGKDGWYVGPQISAAGEIDYRSKAIAAVVGKKVTSKNTFGFVGSLGISKSATAGSKPAPYLSASINYGF